MSYNPNAEQKSNLRCYKCSFEDNSSMIAIVYAKNAEEARTIFNREMEGKILTSRRVPVFTAK